MPVSMHLLVPSELGVDLLENGFDQPFRRRDPGSISDAISASLAVVGPLVPVVADSITVLVGTGEIAALINRVRSWLRRRDKGETAELSARILKDGRQLTVSLRIEGSLTDADGQIVRDVGDTIAEWLNSQSS